MEKGLLLTGEPMGLLIAKQEGALETVKDYSLDVAGAEFNVATGIARLGHKATYLTKLGNDPFGKLIENAIKQNGIDNSQVRYSDTERTGFMLKGKVSNGDPQIFYFRSGSAASTLSESDVESVDFSKFSNLHLTGIMAAVSESTLKAVYKLIELGRKAGLYISFDPNLRPQLWKSKEIMVRTLNDIASKVDMVLPGEGEGDILCGSSDPKKINEFYLNNGASCVITKCGPKGAFCSTRDGDIKVAGFIIDKVVDTVGAGDGFAAGVLSAHMEGLPLEKAVERGCAIGAIQCTFTGDNEGLPTPEELEKFIASHKRCVF
ncbi:sugar kinase [uncultured Succinivibrio sp.]|uniref:sugar kinase n=1 Tax=uncultured Succinivibrio sp. TaxID=540749 RepID=UPI0025FA219E|nr:sugar kinase [uncultured Succinivibrio sp.]